MVLKRLVQCPSRGVGYKADDAALGSYRLTRWRRWPYRVSVNDFRAFSIQTLQDFFYSAVIFIDIYSICSVAAGVCVCICQTSDFRKRLIYSSALLSVMSSSSETFNHGVHSSPCFNTYFLDIIILWL